LKKQKAISPAGPIQKPQHNFLQLRTQPDGSPLQS
jgi:hypothetical protein